MDINNTFYNLLNYYRSVSISKQLTSKGLLTEQESKNILEKLRQYYKIQEILDEAYISDI